MPLLQQSGNRRSIARNCWSLAPVTPHPNIAPSVPSPVPTNSDRARIRPNYPAAAYPNPTAVPRPVSRHPNILRTGRDGHYLNLRGRGRQRRLDGDGWSRLTRRVCSDHSLGLAIRRRRWITGLLILVGWHILNPTLHAARGQGEDADEK